MSEKEEAKHKAKSVVAGVLGACATCVSMYIACISLCVAVVAIIPDAFSILTPKRVPEAVGLTEPIRLGASLQYAGPWLIPEELDPLRVSLDRASPETTGWTRPTYNAIGGNSLVLELSSRAAEAMIAVEPEVLFQVVDHSPAPKLANMFTYLGTGGGAYYRNFVVTLTWNGDSQTRYKAEFGEESLLGLQYEDRRPPELAERNQPDFFTFAPGEVEIFIVELRFEKPGIYRLLAGVEYSYEGKRSEQWLNEPVTAYVPGDYVVWVSRRGENHLVSECRFRVAAPHECKPVEEDDRP